MSVKLAILPTRASVYNPFGSRDSQTESDVLTYTSQNDPKQQLRASQLDLLDKEK